MRGSEVDFDVAVLGAGAVGLACADSLSHNARSVVVIERHARAGQETSSRNSGVVHAGIYYPAGSLKARLCLRGRHLLEARSQRGHFAYRRTGKLIVAATDDETPRLAALAENSRACGIDLPLLDRVQIRRLEPEVSTVAGLFSRESGIVDPDGLVSALRRGAAERGATFAFGTTVTALEPSRSGWTLQTRGKDGTVAALRVRHVVNAAGLEADRVAALAGVEVDALGLRQIPCKGSYFSLAPHLGRRIRHLVYPLPSGGGLGVHLTLDLAGGVRVGPDAEYGQDLDYSVDQEKRGLFAEAVRRYLPAVKNEDLSPAHAGIRPKLGGPSVGFRDFVIERAGGAAPLAGLINLLGIESPGLTACLAIAEHVEHLVTEAD